MVERGCKNLAHRIEHFLARWELLRVATLGLSPIPFSSYRKNQKNKNKWTTCFSHLKSHSKAKKKQQKIEEIEDFYDPLNKNLEGKIQRKSRKKFKK